MENKPSSLVRGLLWGQLICFIIAVSFVAGGGQTPDKIDGYNSFVYLKALFLGLPFLVTFGWMSVSFFKFFTAFKYILKQHWALALYFIFAFVSLIFAYDRSFSMGRLLYTGGSVLSLWCLMAQYKICAGDDLKPMINRHLLSVFSCMIIDIPALAILNSGQGAFADMRGAIQLTSLIHPNTVAAICAYGFFHALFYPSSGRGLEKLLRGFVVIATPILIMVIFSRSVIGAMILALMISGWFAFLWFRSYLALATIGAISFIGVLTGFLVHLQVIPFKWLVALIARTQDGSDLLTLTHRTQLWQRLLEQLDFKMLMVGNGYGVMTPGFGVDFGTGTLYGAHNIYLSILLGTGVFSLFAFLGYLGSVFMRLRKRHGEFGIKTSLHGITMLSFFMIHSLTSTEFSLNLGVSFTIVMLMASLGFSSQGERS